MLSYLSTTTPAKYIDDVECVTRFQSGVKLADFFSSCSRSGTEMSVDAI